MKKKPVINYGWKSFKYAVLFVVIIVVATLITYFYYRKKSAALYIVEELYKYEDLNISGFEEILSKDLKLELTPGIETKVIIYSDDIQSFDGYLGVVEVYDSEPYARIRRSSLKYTNMYYDSLTNDYIFLMNNKNNVYLYKNVILRLSPYITEEWEDLFIKYLKEILTEVTLNNKSVMTPREINIKTEEVNKKIKSFIDGKYDPNKKERIEF